MSQSETILKPFQKATVEAAVKTLTRLDGPRRFLVADEVGLGKTVVAQQVIRTLMDAKPGPRVVFYFCSNLSIASQNRGKILEIIAGDDVEKAVCEADRLTLLPALSKEERPSHRKLHLYTLTPETSLPIRTGARRDGKKEERVIIHLLVQAIWPTFFKGKGRGGEFFRFGVSEDNWSWYIEEQRTNILNNKKLRIAFYKSVCAEFGQSDKQALLLAFKGKSNKELIAKFRNALAASALETIKPDLVIFDEFQRFRDLVETDDPAELSESMTEAEKEIIQAKARVLSHLRGDRTESPPALLLLSATPYRLFVQRGEDQADSSHHAEFFDLVEFLYGGRGEARRKREVCATAFAQLGEELRRGCPNSTAAIEARHRVEAILRPVMARTERFFHGTANLNKRPEPLPAPLAPSDLKVFRHLRESLSEDHRPIAVPYWTSIPLPMQTMDADYRVWEQAQPASASDTPQLKKSERDHFRAKGDWAHPRLRALQKGLALSNLLRLPWLPPSLPWWNLAGDWQQVDRPSKLLIFSRFRAVPQAVAALLSYNLETKLLATEKFSYEKATKRKALQPKAGSENLLALFHPSPWLIEAIDPLTAPGQSLDDDIRPYVRRQLEEALRQIGIIVSPAGRIRQLTLWRVKRPDARRSAWELLAQIEKRVGHWSWIYQDWSKLHHKLSRKGEDDEVGLGRLLTSWADAARIPLDVISPDELNELADYALCAPGVVLGRALRRHWHEAVTREGFYTTLEVAWTGLRTYLAQRWFFRTLKSQDENSYPQAIRKAVVEGNLEAVLDEHLWIISRIRSLTGEKLAKELKQGITIRTGNVDFHAANSKAKVSSFSLRCHVAMPFTRKQLQVQQNRSEASLVRERRLRADDLRISFNSPFWPHVLVTTSIGQEGLDFHVWCDSLVHWDLCSNPVDLEQREGRIQRYGGLAVRRALADQLGQEAINSADLGQSPWCRLAQLAEDRLTGNDKSGLIPWWICEGAEIRRYIFQVPLSEQGHRLKWVQQQRLLYRLVLGQPNQEDLLDILVQRNSLSMDEVRQAMLQLSPWFSQQNGHGS